jgi:hypothetical protein
LHPNIKGKHGFGILWIKKLASDTHSEMPTVLGKESCLKPSHDLSPTSLPIRTCLLPAFTQDLGLDGVLMVAGVRI